MPPVTTRYVYWERRGVRLHGHAAVDIPGTGSPLPSVADTYSTLAPQTISFDSKVADFMFWSVTGAIPEQNRNSAFVQTDRILGGSPSQGVGVGPSGMIAIAWYRIRNGPGGPGVFIDAFDVPLGTFSDDPDIVNVVTDSTLTQNANSQGWVPTTSMEQIVAHASLIDAVPFDRWLVIFGNEIDPQAIHVDSSNDRQLDAKAGSNGIAFAFYNYPPGTSPPKMYYDVPKHAIDHFQAQKRVQDKLMFETTKYVGGEGLPTAPWQTVIQPELQLYRELIARIDKVERNQLAFIRKYERPDVGPAAVAGVRKTTTIRRGKKRA